MIKTVNIMVIVAVLILSLYVAFYQMCKLRTRAILIILFYVLAIPYLIISLVQIGNSFFVVNQQEDINVLIQPVEVNLQSILMAVSFSLDIAICLLMISTFFHISVSMQMLGLRVSISSAKCVRNTVFTFCILILISLISVISILYAYHVTKGTIFVFQAVTFGTMVLLLITTMILFLRSMKSMVVSTGAMELSLERERSKVIWSCSFFILANILRAAAVSVVIALNLTNIEDIQFVLFVSLSVSNYLPLFYVIFNHYKVFRHSLKVQEEIKASASMSNNGGTSSNFSGFPSGNSQNYGKADFRQPSFAQESTIVKGLLLDSGNISARDQFNNSSVVNGSPKDIALQGFQGV